MIEIEINPPDIQASFLECLNVCFDHWGDLRTFEWTFSRRVGGAAADLVVLRDSGSPIAGSAVVYRTVRLANHQTISVGIMAGSWTLPEARGQGCFTTMIRESRSLAGRQGSALLLAFVTASSTSSRRLSATGAALFNTTYCVSGTDLPLPRAPLSVSPVQATSAVREEIHRRLAGSRYNDAHFEYSLHEWSSQFIDRPTETEVVALEDVAWCVIERGPDTDRVLALVMCGGASLGDCLASLLRRSMERGRKLFVFCTSTTWRDECARQGLTTIPGYLTALTTGALPFGFGLTGNAPIPEPTSVALADPCSPSFLGQWSIQGGDRT